jgi:hypothetical protein
VAKKRKVPADILRPGEKLVELDERFTAAVKAEFGRRVPGKKQVLIGSLTMTMVPQEAYGSHCTNFYQLGRDHPDYNFAFCTPRRMSIADMRNMVVKLAITGDFDYLYFFDDDTINDRDVLGRLLKRIDEFNAVSAGYFVRGYPFNPMVFEWVNEKKHIMRLLTHRKYKKRVSSDGVLRENVAGVGCGCTLFRVEDFKKIPYPWFVTGYNHTEDAYFFTMAHKNIPDYKVGMDFNIVCGHLCNPIYVDSNNVDVLRPVHKKLLSTGGLSQ